MLPINITLYFDQLVKSCPDGVAVVDGEHRITNKQLYANSLVVAKQISYLLNKKNAIIAVFLPKSVQSVVANFGILYSANAYMNLDVKNPKERIQNIISQIRPSLIITSIAMKGTLPPNDIPLLLIDDLLSESGETREFADSEMQEILGLRKKIIDTDPLCVINTSGSTGTPKGVILNHRSFIDFTARVVELELVGENEIVGSLSPLVFDIYSFELCMLMVKGSTLVLIPDSLAAFPVRLLELLSRESVTFLFWVPTIMVNIANMDILSSVTLPELRMVWFAGEVFPTAKFNYWYKMLPQTTFVNFYGPIEITLDCTYYVVNCLLHDDEPIPIGKPFPNTDVVIITDDGRRAKRGEEGELCVRGSSLSMGYYNDPEKTALAFVQNPLNTSYPELIYRTGDIVYENDFGDIVYKGRKDSMIKHHGYRIELPEIEHAVISTRSDIKNCCAIYDKAAQQIVLFFESANDIESSELKKSLLQQLPRYMLPSIYIRTSELPRNVNGKIDRLRLNDEAQLNHK